tara:strand:+ start:344 stop:733 length:390 start_codon:yes stop_codon:yes gene_type:complete
MCGNDDNVRRGVNGEQGGIDLYTEWTGNVVARRNDANLVKRVEFGDGKSFDVVGRLDGVCEAEGIVVEHKYRVHGLLGYVPFHESVQCHLYMFISGLRRAHLVETFGNRIQIHDIVFSEGVWSRMIDAL